MKFAESEGRMDAIRKIVDSDVLRSFIKIPTSLKNRKVEIIILPVDDIVRDTSKKRSAYGILKEYANPELSAIEPSAWQDAMKTKYADH
jgi:hypothetical protein